MAIYRQEEIDEKLREDIGLLKGIWLLIAIPTGMLLRFLWSLSPHRWKLTSLATMNQKVETTSGTRPIEERLEGRELK